MRGLATAFLTLSTFCAYAQAPLTVTILHTNDMHSRFEPVKQKDLLLGGYARQVALLKQRFAADPNPLLLSAGDVFQGTLYFNTYLGLADAAFMNSEGYAAMALGNHEFDRGPATLRSFIDAARFPVLSANLDLSSDKELKDKVKPWTIVTVSGQRIGIIGAITEDLPVISSPGKEVKMRPLKASVQKAADELTAQGVNKIVLLTHIGYQQDQELAAQLRNVDVIVGGHSHTLLGKLPGAEGAAGGGSYPTVVKDADGREVPIVQAWNWGLVVGRLQVTFDAEGRATSWSGGPLPVDATIAPDPVSASWIAALSQPLAKVRDEVIGQADAQLAKGGGLGNSPMGELIADAMLAATKGAGSEIALMNAGGVRAPLEKGPITFGQAIMVQPFNNTLVMLELTGEELDKALEWGARSNEGSGGLLYVSAGFRYTVDAAKPPGERVSAFFEGKPIQPGRTYKIVTNNFTASGGDGHEVLKNSPGRRLDTGKADVDALVEYIRARSPIAPPGGKGRIEVIRS